LSKAKSRRWWVVIWCIAYVTVVSFFSIKLDFDAGWISGTFVLVLGIVGSWMTVTSLKKKKDE